MKKHVAKKPREQDFYIVGVGGSAGAFSSFKEFLENLPDTTRVAFAIIQHLSPESKSHLGALLSSATRLPFAEVENGAVIKPGHIYIIPPNKSMEIEENTLKLLPRKDISGVNITVDTFFLSLARHKKFNAIGVLLSGSGSDGTLGLKAIKEAGGITFAEGQTAQFSSMPTSAVHAGVVDYILSPAMIAKKIAKIERDSKKGYYASDQQQRAFDFTSAEEGDLGTILALVHRTNNVDFTYYKRGTIQRRILRRMLLSNIQNYHQYAEYLQKNPSEIDSLYQDILIKVTDFFRDPELFEYLSQKLLPTYLKGKSSVRIWVPGCSTGEEVYSMAITAAEVIEKSQNRTSIQIFGTDLSEQSLQVARHGLYPKTIQASVPPAILNKYFIEQGDQYQLDKKIRGICVFAKHNMVADVPFSRLDIISCRNVLIYLDSYLQKKAFPIFHYALNPEGILILGTAESAANFQDLFKQIDKKHKTYGKKATLHRPAIAFPGTRAHDTVPVMQGPVSRVVPKKEENIEKEADILFIRNHASAGIIVNDDLTIFEFRGDISPYLAPVQGRATLNLIRMAHKGFLPKILEMLTKVKEKGSSVKDTFHTFKTDIEMHPLGTRSAQEKYFLILFRSLEPKVTAKMKRMPLKRMSKSEVAEAAALQKELSSTIEQLQAVIEARDASNEELRSAHEEVMSANEELQSTNEELETTKEELQSTNEELMTLNTELENRNTDLERSARELYRKDEFLSFLGHELRNPLSPIVHALELAKLRGIQDTELKELFEIIGRQTKLLDDIIKDLLDAARAIGGKIGLHKELTDFDTVVNHAIETVAPLINESGHTLEVHHLPRPLSIVLDPGRVEQIIINLLNNAAKYTKPGGRIIVRAAERGDRIWLSVKDTGMGIPQEVLPHIFTLFFQGNQSLSNFKGGLGVGLMLAGTLAKLHGGTLTAKSEGSGKGSEFILELPIRKGVRAASDAKDVDVKNLRLAKKRILVVDDNVELANVFGRLLRELGQDVAVSHSSTAAIPMARDHKPEIIFIDVAMPHMSGYELIRILRAEEGLEKTLFIALSGFGKEFDRRSLEAGFDEHVIKPVALAELRRILSVSL